MKTLGPAGGGYRAAAALLGLTALFGGTSLAWGAEVPDLLRAAGLQPIEPPRPATDFELPRLGGGRGTLSEYSGDWVILTFWASWCGPCRIEMPSLEALHRSHADRGVVVLGISVDQQRQPAEAFLGEYGLTFPQLWDDQGRLGREYRATAIPMTYLIDPRGHLVALTRGARDWTEMSGLMDELIARVPPGEGGEAVYAETFDLPPVLDPPSASLVLSDPEPRVGDSFTLDIRLRWAGRPDEYLPQPPRVQLPAGVTQERVTASTSSRDGSQVIVYRVSLRAEEPGVYALDPVELRYRPLLASDEAVTRIEGTTVSVQPRTVLGMRPRVLALGAGGLAATAVAALVAARSWRARRTVRQAGSQDPYEDLAERYRQVRSLRLQGDQQGFALGLVSLLREVPVAAGGRREDLGELEEKLRYSGEIPATADLDRWQREVERYVSALRPDPDAAARQSLRLEDNEERT